MGVSANTRCRFRRSSKLIWKIVNRVAVKITNRGHKDYTVNVILRVDTVDYTGKNGSLVTKVEQKKVVLHDPGKHGGVRTGGQ